MSRREWLAILALVIVLFALAVLYPRHAASDVPIASSRIPASEFTPVLRAAPERWSDADAVQAQPGAPDPLSGQSTPGAPLSPTPSPAAAVPRRKPVPLRSASEEAPGVTGIASWFRSPINVSAAGPALRSVLGPSWRGTRVRVTGPAGWAWVTLGDWMARDRLIDLDDGVFVAVCGAS